MRAVCVFDADGELFAEFYRDDYVTKPVKSLELEAMLQRWISSAPGRNRRAV